jgi:hypothetical protein
MTASHLETLFSPDLETSFKLVIKRLILHQIHPALDEDETIWSIATEKVNAQASGYSSSKFSSSAWRPDFVRALNARPIMSDFCPGVPLSDSCMACGRSSHPAMFRVHFRGRVYDRDTLEPLDAMANDNDEESYDGDGNPVVPENHAFLVGKDCRNNAIQAHYFRHWRFKLNKAVLEYMHLEGWRGIAQIAENDDWSAEQRQSKYDMLVDEIERNGVLEAWWAEFAEKLDRAENVGRSRRWS